MDTLLELLTKIFKTIQTFLSTYVSTLNIIKLDNDVIIFSNVRTFIFMSAYFSLFPFLSVSFIL